MSEKTIQYGPFTPRELDLIAGEMQLKNIPFEIVKDEDEEGRFRRIDYANLVKQVEFRTEQYMAQIFYVTIAKSDLKKLASTLEKLGFAGEAVEDPKELAEFEQMNDRSNEDIFLKAKTERKKFNRRMVARLLALGLICQILLVIVYLTLD